MLTYTNAYELNERPVIRQLSRDTYEVAHRTISSNAFYYIVQNSLACRYPLSVVRMGDGERTLLDSCVKARDNGKYHYPVTDFDVEWRIRMGIEGITYANLHDRLLAAGDGCNYFAPNVNGLTDERYSLYGHFRAKHYVDNFFVNQWSNAQLEELYKATADNGGIVFLHANRGLADAFQIRLQKLGVHLQYLELNKWEQGEYIIKQVLAIDAPLVLFSGGPALKYIGPRIAIESFSSGHYYQPKVVLDIGNAAERCSLPHLQ